MPGRKGHVKEFALSCLLPGACLVFDRFRVIKKMNETLDDLLWDLARQAQNREEKAITINRKIRTLLNQACGHRDDDFLRLKLYSLHEAKHKLIG